MRVGVECAESMIAGECGSQYPSNAHTGIRRTRDLVSVLAKERRDADVWLTW